MESIDQHCVVRIGGNDENDVIQVRTQKYGNRGKGEERRGGENINSQSEIFQDQLFTRGVGFLQRGTFQVESPASLMAPVFGICTLPSNRLPLYQQKKLKLSAFPVSIFQGGNKIVNLDYGSFLGSRSSKFGLKKYQVARASVKVSSEGKVCFDSLPIFFFF